MRSLASALKVLGIGILVLCLIEPLVSSTRARPGANQFVLLADDSASLQIRDVGRRETRAEVLHALLEKDTAWQTRLSQDFEVSTYRFDERLQRLDDETELRAQGVGSSLMTALGTIAGRFADRPLAGVMVLTDGNATDISPDKIDWSGLPPIYPVAIGSDSAVQDVLIRNVSVSQTNFEQTPVTIKADVVATGYGQAKVAVQLLDESGKQLEEQTVEVQEKEPRAVRFQLRPELSGVSFYQLRAAAKKELWQFDSPEKSKEATLANNSRLVVVDRPKGPYRVLYVSGRPNWEFKFLRRAVSEDNEVEMVGVIRIAKREPKFTYLGHMGERTNPLYRGFHDGQNKEEAEEYDEPVLYRLGTEDKSELRAGFPKKANELFEYHAVILDDIESAFFKQDQMLLLQRFISRRGGGLLMLGGAESFRQGDYRRTPIGELLPVYLDRQTQAPTDEQYRLALTREGWLQPWIRLRETEQAEQKRLAAMPAFATLNRVSGIKPGASVLAEVTDKDGKRYPVLVAQRFGKGRTAALTIGDLWHWSLQRKPDEEDDQAKAWRQLVRWLVAEVPRRVEVDVQRLEGRPGTAVEIQIAVRDAEFNPLDNASVEVAVTTPKGKKQKLRASPSEQRPGTYVATCSAKEEGAYRCSVSVTAADGSDISTRQAGWVSEPAANEYRQLEPNLALLERLSQETNGQMVEASGLNQFVKDLPNRKVPITEAWVYPLWHHPLVLLLAVLCLTAEWGLRRWKGLP